MIHAQDSKEVILVVPKSIDTGGATGTVDTTGYRYAVVRTVLAAAATTASLSAFKLSEADGTSYTDITEFTGGTSTGNFTLPTATGTDATGEVMKFFVDLNGRKKNLKVTVTPSAARIGTVTCELFRAEQTPITASGRGLVVGPIG